MKHLPKTSVGNRLPFTSSFASAMFAAAIVMAAPAALAQGAAPAKPAAKAPAKPDAKKAAEDQRKAEAAEDKAVEDAKKAEEAKAAAAAEEEKKKALVEPKTAAIVEPPHEEWSNSDVEELPSKNYLFIGARYRGNLIPQFMLNLFVDRGATIYSNTVGIELDKRKDGFSIIPALSFTEYGTGDIVFKEKGSKDIAPNYSLVNSSMKAIYATVDLLWSTKVAKNVDFEYGFGVGLGVVFGSLVNNWVYRPTPGSPLVACQTEGQGGPGSGCNKSDHQNASVAKVGGYEEKSWFDGGSRPSVFPYISIPQVGLRFKPIKQFEGRLGLGFSLTGFWFGLSGGYGLEQKPKP